ncbi:MAG: hypothetical protein ABFD44_08795 [Anaerolineaceae bacterium]
MKFARTGLRIPRIMGFAIIIMLLCTAGITPKNIQAAPNPITDSRWVVVASQEMVNDPTLGAQYYDAIYTMDTSTNTVYGPFLMNELTTLSESGTPLGGDIFDVAITPDGKTALLSSFGNQLVHFVDISDPLNPVYLSSVKIDFYAEDIAITDDGHYALVTDGGFTSSLFSIDITTRTLVCKLYLPVFEKDAGGNPVRGFANAVAVAPDGTVMVADYFNGAIHTFLMGDYGGLTYTGTHRYYISPNGDVSLTPKTDYKAMRPVNVSIAPDGKTVLVSDVLNYADTNLPQYTNQFGVGVYKITNPGKMEYVNVITGLSHAIQTITFNETGNQAVMLGNFAMTYDETANPSIVYSNDRLYVMDILGPGEVVFDPSRSADLLRNTQSQLFGVDGLAVTEGKAYASYPTLSIDSTLYPERYLSVVDLNTLEVTQVDWGLTGSKTPVGVAAVIPHYYQYIPLVTK